MFGSISSIAGGLTAGLIGGGLGYLGQAQANSANKHEARKNRAFQERMSNTAHQRQIKDLRAANINPILSAKLGGATTPSGAQATMQNELGAGVNSAQTASATYNQTKMVKEQAENIATDTQLKTNQRDKTYTEIWNLKQQLRNLREEEKIKANTARSIELDNAPKEIKKGLIDALIKKGDKEGIDYKTILDKLL